MAQKLPFWERETMRELRTSTRAERIENVLTNRSQVPLGPAKVRLNTTCRIKCHGTATARHFLLGMAKLP